MKQEDYEKLVEQLERDVQQSQKILEEQKVEWELSRRRVRMRQQLLITYLGLVFALISAITLIFTVSKRDSNLFTFGRIQAESDDNLKRLLASVDNEQRELNKKVELITAKYSALSGPPEEASKLAAQVADLSIKLEQANSRIALIEKSISNDPERALSIPLLRRDLEFVARRLDMGSEDLSSLASSVEVIRNSIIAGMGTLLLASLGMLGKVFLDRNKPGSEGKK